MTAFLKKYSEGELYERAAYLFEKVDTVLAAEDGNLFYVGNESDCNSHCNTNGLKKFVLTKEGAKNNKKGAEKKPAPKKDNDKK